MKDRPSLENNFDLEDTDMIPAGTEVPEGFYTCLKCSKCIPIFSDGDKLPICPECNSIYWMKI